MSTALFTATGARVRRPNLFADTNKTLTRAKLFIESDGKISGLTKPEYFGVLDYLARTIYSAYVGQSKETMVRNDLNIFNEVGTGSYIPTDVSHSIKLSRVPQGVSHIEKNGTEHMEYKSSYVREGQVIQVSRTLRSQQAGRVCQPENMDAYEKMHRVIRRDVLSQIFYE